MRKSAFIIILFIALFANQAEIILAQNPSTVAKKDSAGTSSAGQSYAMIIGISTYKHIRPLSFADSDAGLFKEYLQSAGAGNITDDHMLFLVNENATAANFWVKGMAWLRQKNLKAGDRLFIYLAGHGDAINQDEYFFLTYDCNPAGDKNNYIVTGSIQLYNLKSRIAEISRKNVEVYLIMDACRTNELPGGEDGQQIFNSAVSERKAGEVIMLATGAGQESMEDASIGNGHGLFTYYLVDGLSGLADGYEGKDGLITLVELRSYVLSKVPVLAIQKYKKKQDPFICCDDGGKKIVAHVDSTFLKKWEMSKSISGMNDGGVNDMVRNVRGRGALLVDSNIVVIYNQFNQSIRKLKLTGDSSADFFYNELYRLYPDNVLTIDARQTLAAEFVNFAQRKINLYLSGKDATGIQQMRTQLDESQRSEEIQAGIERLQYIAGLDFGNIAGMLKKAIDLVDPADEELVKSLRAKMYFFQAKSFFDEKNRVTNMQEARHLIYQSYALDSNAAYVLHTIASLQLQLKKYDSAVYFSQRAINKAPKWKYPYTTAAFAYAQMKNFDKARLYYEKAIELDPKSADAYVDLGYFEFQQKKIEKAQGYYQKALQLDPSNVSALNNMGWLMKEKGKSVEALQYFKKCVQTDSSFVHAYNGIARAYGALKQYDSARIYYLRSVNYYVDQAYVYNLLGNFFKEINLGDSALFYYHCSINLDATYTQPYVDLAKLFEQNKRLDSAAFYYRKIISMNPQSKNSYLSLAAFYQSTRSADSANVYFTKAINLDPADAETYNSIGVYYFRKNLADSARKYFVTAVRLDPLKVLYVTNLAAVYSRDRRYDSAFYCLHRAIELSPGDAQIYNSIASLYKKQNQLDSALVYYKQAYQLNNENISVLVDMADVYRDLAESDSAIAKLQEAISLKPEVADFYNSVGVIYLKINKYDSAKLYLQKAVDLNPAYVRAFNNLGNLSYVQGNYEDALNYYRQALKIDSVYENPLLFSGLSYINLHKHADAIPFLEKLLKENSKSGSGYYYLSVCYAAVSNSAKALFNLEQALKLKYGEPDSVWGQKEFETLRNTTEFKNLIKTYFPGYKF